MLAGDTGASRPSSSMLPKEAQRGRLILGDPLGVPREGGITVAVSTGQGVVSSGQIWDSTAYTPSITLAVVNPSG